MEGAAPEAAPEAFEAMAIEPIEPEPVEPIPGVNVIGLLWAAARTNDRGQAEWVVGAFALVDADVRLEDNRALREAARANHLDFIEWLAHTFDLWLPTDGRAGDNELLRQACRLRNGPMAAWVADRYQLTTEDARACESQALGNACATGDMELVEWLADRFDLGAHDMFYSCGVDRARMAGHPDMVEYATQHPRFALQMEDDAAWAAQVAAAQRAAGVGNWIVADDAQARAAEEWDNEQFWGVTPDSPADLDVPAVGAPTMTADMQWWIDRINLDLGSLRKRALVRDWLRSTRLCSPDLDPGEWLGVLVGLSDEASRYTSYLLEALYDRDLADEETILLWYAAVDRPETLKWGAKFIQWLQTAEEESQES